jgi:CheY-like chemotaxis protein
VVEDNAVNLRLITAMLKTLGYAPATAVDGAEALAELAARSFDLVLMDVQMPVMDGFEATVAIREQEQTSGTHLPIIALTAHALKSDEERCLEAGMDAYVSKPIQTNELLAAIERVAPSRFPRASASRADVDSPGMPV